MILNFRTQKQMLDNWCWAAVTSGVSFYFNPKSRWIQSMLAARLISSSCAGINTINAATAPDTCNSTLDIARSLQLTGNFAGDLMRPLSFNEVVQQINTGFPICCQVVFPGFDTSHFVVVYGYQGANVVIGDSQAGIFNVPYNNFLTNYRGGRWGRTIGTKKNINNV
jgi:Papain-like cysteine protease AvrRpt2